MDGFFIEIAILFGQLFCLEFSREYLFARLDGSARTCIKDFSFPSLRREQRTMVLT
jgi:hypothetical protein